MSLGPVSLKRLAECARDLQRLVREVEVGVDRGDLAPYVLDITVLCGFRGEAEQNQAVADGTSKLRWPDSKHNQKPSRAVDVVPYPIEWKDSRQELILRGYILATAARLGIRVRTISWDLPHFELRD